MILVLDTNVLSALSAVRPPAVIVDWVRARRSTDLFTTTVNQAELLAGLSAMPLGRRRAGLTDFARALFTEDFSGRILDFDVPAALEYAEIYASRRRADRPQSMADTMIAAIARVHNAIVVTRNVRDFDGCGVEVVNPWDAPVT